MASYEPDYDLIKAKEIIEKLNDKNEKDWLLKYYINHQNKEIEKLKKKIEDYQNFFKLLQSFLPKYTDIIG
jgi:hypothetical protein